MQDFSPEEKLASMISGRTVLRFATISGFLANRAVGDLPFGPKGAKVILEGIYQLVNRDHRWYLRRFKSVTSRVEIEVSHDEVLVGEEGEYCQTVWDPAFLVQEEAVAPYPLLDYTSRAEQEKKRAAPRKSVMESLTFM